jgi:transcriptional regulator with XRE-family HTH domain
MIVGIGPAIHRARKNAKMTQRLLAHRACLDASYICAIEKGARIPTLESIEAISGALGVPSLVLYLDAATPEERAAVVRRYDSDGRERR